MFWVERPGEVDQGEPWTTVVLQARGNEKRAEGRRTEYSGRNKTYLGLAMVVGGARQYK